MTGGAWALAVTAATVVAILAFLVFSMIRSMQDERSEGRSIWREFGLSIVLVVLFLASWVGQGVSQWQTFTDEEHAHGEQPALGDFAAEFGASTLENWQSEFLQLFSFVVLAALYIHKGSSESKDSEEKIEASLKRIEQQLGTLPSGTPRKGTDWRLPETPLELADKELAEGPAAS